MKPDPEELQDTTTPKVVEEMDAAGDRFYEGTEYPEGLPDWRKVPSDEDEEED